MLRSLRVLNRADGRTVRDYEAHVAAAAGTDIFNPLVVLFSSTTASWSRPFSWWVQPRRARRRPRRCPLRRRSRRTYDRSRASWSFSKSPRWASCAPSEKLKALTCLSKNVFDNNLIVRNVLDTCVMNAKALSIMSRERRKSFLTIDF